MQFLMGLNDPFKTARGNILMMKLLPSLNQAYKLTTQEEIQRDCTTITPFGLIYGHFIERCFKIHKYPKSNKGNTSTGQNNFTQGKRVASHVFAEGGDEMRTTACNSSPGDSEQHSNEFPVSSRALSRREVFEIVKSAYYMTSEVLKRNYWSEVDICLYGVQELSSTF